MFDLAEIAALCAQRSLDLELLDDNTFRVFDSQGHVILVGSFRHCYDYMRKSP